MKVQNRNLWDSATAVLRGEFIGLNIYIREKEDTQINNLFPSPEKKKRTKWTQDKHTEGIIKIRPEINKIEKRKTTEKIDQTWKLFFENINKIDKPPAILTERICKLPKSGIKRGHHCGLADIKITIRELLYKWLYTYKFHNL